MLGAKPVPLTMFLNTEIILACAQIVMLGLLELPIGAVIILRTAFNVCTQLCI